MLPLALTQKIDFILHLFKSLSLSFTETFQFEEQQFEYNVSGLT